MHSSVPCFKTFQVLLMNFPIWKFQHHTKQAPNVTFTGHILVNFQYNFSRSFQNPLVVAGVEQGKHVESSTENSIFGRVRKITTETISFFVSVCLSPCPSARNNLLFMDFFIIVSTKSISTVLLQVGPECDCLLASIRALIQIFPYSSNDAGPSTCKAPEVTSLDENPTMTL